MIDLVHLFVIYFLGESDHCWSNCIFFSSYITNKSRISTYTVALRILHATSLTYYQKAELILNS